MIGRPTKIEQLVRTGNWIAWGGAVVLVSLSYLWHVLLIVAAALLMAVAVAEAVLNRGG